MWAVELAVVWCLRGWSVAGSDVWVLDGASTPHARGVSPFIESAEMGPKSGGQTEKLGWVAHADLGGHPCSGGGDSGDTDLAETERINRWPTIQKHMYVNHRAGGQSHSRGRIALVPVLGSLESSPDDDF